jgi:hypothetical protein
MEREFLITKASGIQIPFSEEKLRASLERAGATTDQIEYIVNAVKQKLYDGITTRKIYRIAFSLLKEGSRHLAARYHLKQAIMELGPSGFPFEKYISELLQQQGYRSRVGQILQGACITHEIDVIAVNEKEQILIECKYHNYAGVSCDVKVPLYIHSRFRDVDQQHTKLAGDFALTQKRWVVTNTRFTDDAMQYAKCAGLFLLGWDYPANGSLKEQIDKMGLYPITCLTSLTQAEKQHLLDRKIVLCKDIGYNEKLLKAIGVKPTRMAIVMNEAQQLCQDLHLPIPGISQKSKTLRQTVTKDYENE